MSFFLLFTIFFSFFNFTTLSFQFPGFLNDLVKSQKQLLAMKILYTFQIPFTTIAFFNVVLLSFGKQSAWFWGAVGYLFFGLSAIPFGYGSIAMGSLFFVVWIEIFGSFWWSAKQFKYPQEEMVISKLKISYCVLLFLLFALLFALFYEMVPYFTYYVLGNKYGYIIDKNIGITSWTHAWAIQLPRFIDAFCGAGNVICAIATTFILRMNWILWIIVNVLQAILFCEINGQGINWNLFILNIIYVFYSLYSIYIWYCNNNFCIKKYLF